jgi:23S rRNA (uracil1939-C5)-methyltransferase
LCNSNDVETVVVLRDKKVDGHISIDLDVEKLEIQDKKATYDEIKAYVSEKYGYKISSLYIAQVKERAGIQKRENYNIGEGKGVVPHCPPEKEEAIKDALRHFGMIGLN